MPRHRAGAPEDAGGYDASPFAWRRDVLAAARAGDPTAVRQDLRANCS